jgi:hypothetical protein
MNQDRSLLMKRTVKLVLVLAAAGCSGTEPSDPGTFVAHLTGAASQQLTGESHAGVVYTEDNPEGQFTISMFHNEGNVTRSISITCVGLAAPSPGSHSLTPVVERCVGRYTRFTLNPFTTIEAMESSEGTLLVRRSDETGVEGTFSFSGILVQGTDSLGSVEASGSFNAIR